MGILTESSGVRPRRSIRGPPIARSSKGIRDTAYDPTGQPKSFTYGNGPHTEIGLDDRGRTTSVSSPAVELVYGYDGADNVTRFDDQKHPGVLRTMTYDRVDRLQTVQHATLGFSQYQYDPLGNRLWSPLTSEVSTRFEYDEHNRLEWASQALRPTTALTLEWDHANRLVRSSDGATYRYDGHDRRVAKTEGGATTVYHHDAAGRVIGETLLDGTRLRDYVYLGAKLVAVDGCMEGAVASGCTFREWYHTDTLGSVRAPDKMKRLAHCASAWISLGVRKHLCGQSRKRRSQPWRRLPLTPVSTSTWSGSSSPLSSVAARPR